MCLQGSTRALEYGCCLQRLQVCRDTHFEYGFNSVSCPRAGPLNYCFLVLADRSSAAVGRLGAPLWHAVTPASSCQWHNMVRPVRVTLACTITPRDLPHRSAALKSRCPCVEERCVVLFREVW